MSILVRQLKKSFAGQRVLKDLNFEVKPGRVLGFLGPNGAGKSTTMRIMAGVLAADGGEVLLAGESVAPDKLTQRQQTGYLAEHNPLYNDMYVPEYLRFCGRLHRIPDVHKRIREVIGLTGLAPEEHKQIGHLSKGYRQRVGIAQAILHDPRILILDEPTSGLDPNQLIGIRRLIRQLSGDRTVLLSTHLMQEVEAVCDDVVIIHQGEIVAQCALTELADRYGVSSVEELFVRLTH